MLRRPRQVPFAATLAIALIATLNRCTKHTWLLSILDGLLGHFEGIIGWHDEGKESENTDEQ